MSFFIGIKISVGEGKVMATGSKRGSSAPNVTSVGRFTTNEADWYKLDSLNVNANKIIICHDYKDKIVA